MSLVRMTCKVREKWVDRAKKALKSPDISEEEKEIIREELSWQRKLRQEDLHQAWLDNGVA